MIICEDCKKPVDLVRHRRDGKMVCEKCNPVKLCPTCKAEITMDSDRIGNRCVECYVGDRYENA